MSAPIPPSIDRALVEHLADLARLRVSPERLPVLRERLERIVAAFSALQTAGEGAADPGPPLRLRPDQASPPLPVDTVLANAPSHAAGAFVVPRVVDA